jgi:hypothetical protein
MNEMQATNDDTKTTAGPSEFERRLARKLVSMEVEIRRLRARARIVGLALLGTLATLGGAIAWMATLEENADSGGVVEAQRIVLAGADGRPRGEWSIDEDGHASLSMYDRQQRERVVLSVRREGDPGLSLLNSEGERRVALGLLPDETTSLVFADGAGVPRAVLGLLRGDDANMLLADAQGVSRIGFGLDGRGLGSVLLPDEEPTEGAEGEEAPPNSQAP